MKLTTGTYWNMRSSLMEYGIYGSCLYNIVEVNYRYECGCIVFQYTHTLDEFKSLIDDIEFDYHIYINDNHKVYVHVEIPMDSLCIACENTSSSEEDNVPMLNYLIKCIRLVQDKGYSQVFECPASDIPSVVERHILDALIEFCKKSPCFHVEHDVHLAKDWEYGAWGAFSPTSCDVYVNDKLVYGLLDSLNIGVTLLLEKLVVTVLHEHRHALQEHAHFPMVDVPYTSPEVDYDAYWNHPTEVDAREAADMYLEDAMGYVIDVLRKKYLSHLYNK